MKGIYHTEATHNELTMFKIYEGSGEHFDLSKSPSSTPSSVSYTHLTLPTT